MRTVQEIWRALSPGRRLAAAAGLLTPVAALVLVAALAVQTVGRPGLTAAGPEPSSSGSPSPTAPALPPAPTPGLSATPAVTPSPTPPAADPILGTDGRLTVLLLGSDYRPSHPGNRTDAIIVTSVDPATGAAAAFSIPRDTERFPLPDGTVYGPKVNALYQHLARSGDAGPAMREVIAAAYDIEVDGYVFIGFTGVIELVRAVGGVDVTLDRAYYDPYYWVNNRTQGWGLPAGTSHLGPEQALIFARSRQGDNDFGRARRQQLLIMGALERVRALGPEVVPDLLEIGGRTVRTDLPLASADDLYAILSGVDLETVRRVVFGPRTYADDLGGSRFAANVAAGREWIAANFPPVTPFGQWPPAPTLAPTPSASPPGPATPSAVDAP